MIVRLFGKEHQFPMQVERHEKKVWQLKEIIDALYDESDHVKSIQNLWDILSLMQYMTLRGREGRSLKLITFDNVSDLIVALHMYKDILDVADKFAFPRCEQSVIESNIILDPRGYVLFDDHVHGVQIIS